MSRVYHNPPTSTARRPPAARSSLRPTPPASTTNRPTPPASTINRSMTRGARAPTRGRTMHTQPPRQERTDIDPYHDADRTKQQERTTHVGDGYHMFTPSTTRREQMRRQAENEQRQYEEHIERTRLHGLHEVNRLGGDGLSVEEVRRRQAEKYRRGKFERLEKSNEEQFQKKQEEERDINAKKQAARRQTMENEKRDRSDQLNSMRPRVDQYDQGATGWTEEAREDDRRETMDRFLNRLTTQYDDMSISSNPNENKNHNNASKSEKLSILRDMLPYIDDPTLEYHLEIYNGNIDAIVQELLN